jgi:hypothetical protein|nr:MAG TPA: Nuclease [Caudoviricetes sp.]
MRETEIEHKLCYTVTQAGGHCWKFTSPGTAGVPDRIVLLPGGHVGFIELKAPGKKLRPLQQWRLEQIHALGIPAHVIDHPDQIQEALDAIRAA